MKNHRKSEAIYGRNLEDCSVQNSLPIAIDDRYPYLVLPCINEIYQFD